MEAELEEKRREQERKHEERMMTMMMGFMQQMVNFPCYPPGQPQHSNASFIQPTLLPSPFASTPNSHQLSSLFPPTRPDTTPPYLYRTNNIDDADV